MLLTVSVTYQGGEPVGVVSFSECAMAPECKLVLLSHVIGYAASEIEAIARVQEMMR